MAPSTSIPLFWSISFAFIGFLIAQHAQKGNMRGQMFSEVIEFAYYSLFIGAGFAFGLIIGLIHYIIKS